MLIFILLLLSFVMNKKEFNSGITNVSLSDDNCYYTCNFSGSERKFILYVPEGVGENSPLLFILHGYSTSAESFEQKIDLNKVADEYGYAVVYPQGISDPNDKTSAGCWNSGFKKEGNDDTAFLVALAEYLQKTYGFNRDETFAAGFSNGAFMMYRLACEAPDTFRAVASVAGTMTGTAWEERDETTSIGILQINGTKDDVVPLSGSYGNAPAIDGVIEYWKDANGLERFEEIKMSDKATAYCYSSDTNDNLVWYIEIEGGHHSWPVKELSGIDANKVILEFFNNFIE